MIFALLFLALWLPALLGWGTLMSRCVGGKSMPKDFALEVLLGLLPVTALGYFFHLFSPLASWPAVVVLAVGWALGVLTVHRIDRGNALLWLGSGLLVSIFCARLMIHGDSGGYHTQAILWTAEEPVVRGLANLTSVYGYNPSWWILAGLMARPFGAVAGATLVSAPLLVAVGVLIGGAVWRILRRETTFADWFWVPAVYLWLRQLVGVNTPSPTTDVPANLLLLAAVWTIIRRPSERPFEHITSADGRIFLSLSLLAAMAKLNTAPLLGFGLVWFAAVSCIQLARNLPAGTRTLLTNSACLLPAALCGVLFLFHGWLLSGYPLFPSTAGGWWTVPWQVPDWLANHTINRAREWAVTFGATAAEIQNQPAWKIWLGRQGGYTNLVVAAGAALALLAGGIFLLRSRPPRHLAALVLPVTAAAVGMAWNLWQAPALRFASGFAFCLLGCGAALLGPSFSLRAARVGVTVWMALSVAALAKLIASRPIALFVLPPPLSPAKIVEQTTRDGYLIRIAPEGFCWFAQKPTILGYEFDEYLVVLKSRSGRIVEMRGGKTAPPR